MASAAAAASSSPSAAVSDGAPPLAAAEGAEAYAALRASLGGDAAAAAATGELLQRLQQFYGGVTPRFTEVTSEDGSSQSCLIDGDALLAEVLSDPRLSLRFAGQPLHAVYLVERLLSKLIERGADVSVVFFECYRPFWETALPQGAVLRSLLLAHLGALGRREFSSVTVTQLPNWFDGQFERLLDAEHPAFIGLSAVEALRCFPAALPRERFRALQHCFLAFLLRWAQRVVFLGELEFREFHTSAFYCSDNRKKFAPTELPLLNRLSSDILDAVAADAAAAAAAAARPLAEAALAQATAELAATPLVKETLGARAVVAAAACRQFVVSDSSSVALTAAKLFLVHVALLSELGIADRALRAAGDVVPVFGSFYSRHAPDTVTCRNQAAPNCALEEALGKLAARVARSAAAAADPTSSSAAAAEGATTAASGAALVDCFDGRLLERVFELRGLCAQPQLLGTSAESLRALDALWAFVAAGAPSAAAGSPFFPVASDVPAPSALADLPQFEVPERAAPVAATSMRTRLFAEFFEDKQLMPEASELQRLASSSTEPLENIIITRVKAANDTPVDKNDRVQAIKEVNLNQKLLRFLHRQAGSLEGTAIFERETIIIDEPKAAAAGGGAASSDGAASSSGAAASEAEPRKLTKREQKEQEKAERKAKKVDHSGGKGGKKGGAEKESMREKIVREAEEARRKEAVTRAQQQWENQKEQVARSRSLDEQINLIELARKPNQQVPSVYFDATLKMLQLYQAKLNETHGMQYGGLIFDLAFETLVWLQEYSEIIEPKLQRQIGQKVAGILFDVGFEVPAVILLREIAKAAHASVRDKIAGDMKMLAKQIDNDDDDDDERPDAFRIDTSHIRFQLEHMGERLTRERGIRDDRVHVRLDKWQQPVLDLMDRRDSALICAPTSSGKTFLSYYLMKNVLKDGAHPRGVAVFVSPTKALVNQVEAQVFRMFGSVHGIFTEKYERQMDACRILVTTPECFEALLMSPYHREFVDRIRYAILDEIHTINGELGQFWERLLLLLPCPFVALSATVGNPVEFADWLQSMENEKKALLQSRNIALDRTFAVRTIQHKERFADLRHFVFLSQPPAMSAAAGESEWPEITDAGTLKSVHLTEAQLSKSHELVHLHPCAAVPLEVLRATGFPSELNFEPRDTLQLFDCMRAVSKGRGVAAAYATVKHLKPDTFFKVDIRLARSRVREYERALKAVLYRWGEDFPALQAEVMRRLGSETADKIVQNEKAWSSADKPVSSIDTIAHNLFDLVLTLDSRDMLPAIAFNFDRFLCEKLAIKLVGHFERGEAHYRQRHATEFAQKLKRFELWKKRKADQAEAIEKAKSERVKLELQRANTQEADADAEFESFDPDAEVEEYILNRPHQRVQPEEWRRLMWDIGRKMDRHSPLIKILRRGVGVHHAGLPRKYLQNVEIMFRRGQLRVVFATNTLALGIHMPCRTVIFAGDSQALNPMEFRQMEGRAGRRGYDLKGNVVFFGVPNHKIRSLLTAPVSDLRGRFPFRASTVLRMNAQHSLLRARGADTESSLCRQLVVLRKPLYSPSHLDVLRQSKQLTLRASQFLVEMGFSDALGELTGAGDLAQFLYDDEPFNFALLSILTSDAFDDVCEMKLGAADQACIILASILARIPAHPALLCSPAARQLSALGVLPPLPAGVEKVLLDYNYDTFVYFFQAIREFCRALPHEAAMLPLSGLKFAWSTARDDDAAACTLLGSVRASALRYDCCAPFVALSGATDNFDSFEELIHNARSGVYLDQHCVPIVPMRHTFSLRPMIVNAAVADFFRQGSRRVLVDANGISSEDIFTILLNFRRAIEAIAGRDANKMSVLLRLRAVYPGSRALQVSDQAIRVLDTLAEDFIKNFDRTAEKQE